MSEVQKDKAARKDKKTSRVPSEGSHGVKHTAGKTKDSLSNVSCIEEHHDALVVTLENTYQMGPRKRFPTPAILAILKDVLPSYLEEEKYEVEWSRQMSKTLCDTSPYEGAHDPQIQDSCLGSHRSAGRAEHADKQPLFVGPGNRHVCIMVLQEYVTVLCGQCLRCLL
ncbi:dynein light chain Tctex-type 5-A-like isoform X2 [Stigmatopora argus]